MIFSEKHFVNLVLGKCYINNYYYIISHIFWIWVLVQKYQSVLALRPSCNCYWDIWWMRQTSWQTEEAEQTLVNFFKILAHGWWWGLCSVSGFEWWVLFFLWVKVWVSHTLGVHAPHSDRRYTHHDVYHQSISSAYWDLIIMWVESL